MIDGKGSSIWLRMLDDSLLVDIPGAVLEKHNAGAVLAIFVSLW